MARRALVWGHNDTLSAEQLFDEVEGAQNHLNDRMESDPSGLTVGEVTAYAAWTTSVEQHAQHLVSLHESLEGGESHGTPKHAVRRQRGAHRRQQ